MMQRLNEQDVLQLKNRYQLHTEVFFFVQNLLQVTMEILIKYLIPS